VEDIYVYGLSGNSMDSTAPYGVDTTTQSSDSLSLNISEADYVMPSIGDSHMLQIETQILRSRQYLSMPM
jgi:hypothetical protein